MNIRQVADEEAEVTEDSMKKAEKALNSIGIVVRDSPSTFRPMFEIIKDLGNNWENLTEVQQAYVAESLAGKRQANVLISTLLNWNMAEKQLEESINASGSALQENEIYMQSWEALSKQFTASLTSLWSHFINTDAVKKFITSSTAIINVLDKLINNSFSSFLIQTGLITTALTLVTMGFKSLKSILTATTIGTIALNTAEKGLIVTTKALTAALLANPLIKIAVVAAGILGIVKAVDALTTSFKEQKEIVANLTSEVNSLQTEYDQLNNKENRTDEEESYLKLLKKEIDTKKELQKIETQELMDKEFFDDNSLGINKINDYITSIKNLKEELNNTETLDERKSLDAKILEFNEKLIESQKSILNYKNILGEIPPELQALSDAIESILSSNDTSDTDDTEKKLSGIAKGADNLSVSLESLQKTLSNAISNIESCNKALDEYNESGKFNLKTIIALAKDYPQLLNCLDDEGAIRQELISIIDEEQKTQETAYANMLMSSDKFYDAKISGNNDLVESINIQYNEMFKQLGIEYEFDLEKFKSLALAKDEVESELIKELANKWAHYYDVASGSLTSLYTEDLIQSQEYAGTEIGDYMASQMSPFMKLHGELLKNRDRFQKIALDASGVDFSRINSSNIDKLSGGSSSSSSSSIDYEDFLAELIRSYNYQVEIDKLQSSSLEKQSKIAERAKDYTKTIELQNKLLDNQNKTITDLQSANEKIHQEAENVRNLNSQWDTETWFDVNGEATVEYKNALNAYAGATDEASKAAHKNIQDTFKSLYNLKKAWRENTEEIEQMGDAIYNTQTKITETLDKVKSAIQDEINKQVEEQTKLIESQKDVYIESSKAKIASIQAELDAMDEQEQALQRQKSIEEKIQNISKANKNLFEARTKLTNTQNEKNTRIFQNGRWEFIADPKAVKDAQKEVEDAQQSLIDAQQSFNDKMAEIAAEDRRKALQQEIEDQKKEQEIKEKYYNDQIKKLEEFKDNFLEDFINGNIQLNEQTKKDFETLGITYNEQLSKLFTIISTWSRQMRGQLQSVIDKKNEAGAGDLSITNTPIDSYDTGGEIDKTKLALVHKGEYMLNKSNVSALGGIKGVKNLLTSLPNLNLTSPIIPKLNINSIIPSNFRSSTSQVDKSVKINSVNLNHVYDVSSFMRNLTALAR